MCDYFFLRCSDALKITASWLLGTCLWSGVFNCVHCTEKCLVDSVYACSAGHWWLLLLNVSVQGSAREKKTNKQKNPRLEALIFVSYCFLDSEIPRMSPTFHFSNFVFTKKNPLILWISLKKINKNQGARQKAVSLKDICPIVPICHALSLRKLQVDILH